MLRVERLSYEIKGRKLLKDISFQVRKGEVLAVLGANGAGKSTLMSLLCGERKPTEGTVVLHGKALAQYDMKELSRCRALLSQQQQMTLAFKVSEIVMMGRYPHFKSSPGTKDVLIVEEVMSLCGIKALADRTFLSLSGGEQQRVQLARVLVQIWENKDALLLLDEPISALDLRYQQKVLAIAKALARRGFMVVLIVHDVNFAAIYADRIIMLKNGRKLFDGTPVEVLNSKDLYAVFSVESVVELSTATLRPHVRLEELILDASLFNSLLPEEGEGAIDRKAELLIERCPYLTVEELASKLAITEFEMWLLDKRSKTEIFTMDFGKIASVLVELGEVRACSRTDGIKHTLVGRYKVSEYDVEKCLKFEGDFDLCFLLDKWEVGMLVENEAGKSVLFFDKMGQAFHCIYLMDHMEMEQGYAKLKEVCLDNIISSNWSPSPCLNKLSRLTKDIGGNTEEINLVRQTLSRCAADAIPVTIKAINAGCVQSFSDTILNLIDQGSKYIIKELAFELEIVWADIKRISCRDMSSVEHSLKIDFFDWGDNLVLEINVDKRGRGEEPVAIFENCNSRNAI